MSDVMIEARDLSKRFGTVEALRDVSFDVRRGEVLGFLGPNGAGKTTTMRILTCFIAPSSGTAKVHGADVFEDPLGARSAIGYLPENTPLYVEMTVLEFLEFAAEMRAISKPHIMNRIKKVVEQSGLGDVITREIRTLSKGYRQRVGLAQALIHEPPILILDEPMSGLDPNQAVEIRDLIKEIGKERTVVLSTHNLAEVQLTCGRVLIISNGRIVADDSPEELQARAGKSRFVVSVLDQNVVASTVLESFRKIPGVADLRSRDGVPGEVVFDLTPLSNEDLRPHIFRAAVEKGYVLVGLAREGQNLEQVFRQLTTGEGSKSNGKKGASEGSPPKSSGSGHEETGLSREA